MVELAGLIGSICFAISAIPAAYHAYRAKACTYPWGFLGLWAFAEVMMIIYAVGTGQWVLLANYAPNIVCLAVLFRYNTTAAAL